MADFLSGKKLHLPNFRDCLKERGKVQMLTIGREAALEVQVRYWQFIACTQIVEAQGKLETKR